MTAKRASMIIVLCEDHLHDVVVRRFLRRWGFRPPIVRIVPYPSAGAGSGKQHVLKSFASQLRAFRSRTASTALLVVMDADAQSVPANWQQLDNAVREDGAEPRRDDEAVAYVIPKWHMQTWLAYLDGARVDENDKESYKRRYALEHGAARIHSWVDQLAETCKKAIPLEDPPASLAAACDDFERVRGVLR